MNQNLFREFQAQIKKITDVEDRKRAVENFIKKVNAFGSPLVENDSTVVFLYKGEVDSVCLVGDMTDWVDTVPFERILDTELFFLRATYTPTARMEYLLKSTNQKLPVPDPLNPYVVLNGFGKNSELAMPHYRRNPIFDEYLGGKKGGYELVTKHELPSGKLPYPHQIYVYVPPGYPQKDVEYATIYFQDGKDYIEYAIAPRVLNELILSKAIQPIIAIFISPPNRHQPRTPNRMTEYGLNDDYVGFFVNELVPFVDANYYTKQKPSARLLVGDSFGGLISVYIAFRRTEVFGLTYSQSGYHSFQNDRLIRLMSSARKKPIRFYVDVGYFERKVGTNLLPESETDFLLANRRLAKMLKQKGYDVVYREYPEGHTWGNWRVHLIDAVLYFFGMR